MGITVSIEQDRKEEIAKYSKLYGKSKYGMGERRYKMACQDLYDLPCRGTYLDVGCGFGEMLRYAEGIGFDVTGTEVVKKLLGKSVLYAEAHSLPFPDNSFDVASMFDVLEHLLPGDDERACQELARVAKHHVLLTANNKPSKTSDFVRTTKPKNLHINIREFDEWHKLLEAWFKPAKVARLQPLTSNLARWRVDF